MKLREVQRARSASPYEPRYGFSRAVRHGPMVAVAGTAPIADDGATHAPHQPEAQTRRCFELALRALAELGATAQQVIRTRMYIVDADDADAVGRAHAEVFAEVAPAATMVVVAGLLRPDWRVEVEVEAWSPEP